MSVRMGILALLSERPQHGYQLKVELEGRTGGTWPINIGQIYTTLQRLERDGLVEAHLAGNPSSQALPAEEPQQTLYALTSTGCESVDHWWVSAVDRQAPSRDELTIKLALAVTVPGVDVPAVVHAQRRETLRTLRTYTRLQRDTSQSADHAWRLVLHRLIFDLDAELRWLDHVEGSLVTTAHHRHAAAEASVVDVGAEPNVESPAEPTRGGRS